jgi:ribonuclease T2
VAIAALAMLAACSPSPPGTAAVGGTASPSAEAIRCTPPTDFAMPRAEPPPPEDVRRTPVTRYTLSLSWSPGFCARRGDRDDAFQCGGDARFGFVLHGLWPETDGRRWPQWCAPADVLPRAVIADHLCMTPSAQLIQHEWAKHGTCMDDDPRRYFDRAAQLFGGVRSPDMAMLARHTDLSVGEFADAFAAANPGMDADMLAVDLDDRGYLEEVRLCLDREFARHACPPASRAAPARSRMRITAPD